MERILVLTPHEDRAGRAAHLALELAERTGASVRLLRVLQESLNSDLPAGGGGARSLRDLLTEVETRQVAELAEIFRARGVAVDVEVTWGVPWSTVIDLVERDGFDLVVKPATGLSQQGTVFFGSTALHLFRRCPCPVWVVGDQGRMPSKILAAVDPQSTPHRREAAMRILGWAERVGEWSSASVHAFSAWEAAAADILRPQLNDADWKSYREDAHSRAREGLEALLSGSPTAYDADRIHLAEGHPADCLPRFASEQGADLIVMGTLGRRDRWGDLLGETAETVIRRIRCSVLTIPPAGDADEDD